jgi:hypothetical protein
MDSDFRNSHERASYECLGKALIEKVKILFNFIIRSIFQLVSILIILPMLFVALLAFGEILYDVIALGSGHAYSINIST